jgi:hypothetical protein
VKGTTLAVLFLLLVGLMVAPFFKDTVGRLLLYLIVGGGVIMLVVFVIVGVILIAFRGD